MVQQSMDSLLQRPWSISPFPSRPLITATIQGDIWNVTTRTIVDSNLTVLYNTLLTLICVAAYPVYWHKGTNRLPQDIMSCHSFIGEEMCSNSSSDGLPKSVPLQMEVCTSSQCRSGPQKLGIPVTIEEYRSTIQFNAQTEIEGIYVCSGIRAQLDTSVQIRIRQKSDVTHPQILLRGFEKAYQPITLEKSIPHLESFIYALPPRSRYKPIIRCPDKNNASFIPKTETLSAGLVMVISVGACEGYSFQFVIEDDSGMEVLKEDFNLTIRTIPILNDSTMIPIDTRSKDSGAVLSKGHIYSIITNVGDFDLDDVWLEVQENDVIYNQSTYCPRREMSQESAQRCGLMAITKKNFAIFYQNPLQLILNASIPCAFSIRFSDTVLRTLHVAIADQIHFGQDVDSVKITTVPFSTNPSSIEVYTNGSLQLQCVIPVCRRNVIVSWCQREKGTCEWWSMSPRLVDGGQGDSLDQNIQLINETGVSIVNQKVDSNTMSLNLIFSRIQKWQAGTYECALFKSSDPILVFPSKGVVNVIVTDSLLSFLDGHDGNGSTIEYLSPNQIRTLDCLVEGRPEPNISWSCSRDGKEIPCLAGTHSPHGLSIKVNQPGIYMCIASNEYGIINRTYTVVENSQGSSKPVSLYLAIVLPILFATLLAVLIILLIDRRRRSRRLDTYFKDLADLLIVSSSQETSKLDTGAPVNDQASCLQYNRNFEIDRNSFSIKGKLLGDGEFGCIYKGELKTPDASVVAVKIPKDPSNPDHHRSLLDELKIMCHIRPHVNVLSLIGACTNGIEKRQLFILTEFCEHGSLKDYLTENRTHFEAIGAEEKSVQTLLNFAYQAANGMVHLAAENIIHRDFALRNLLLTDGQIIKIADFGMSRKHESVYRKSLSADVPIPLFWMALESLMDGQYTHKSDVWSLGIVLWEMFNCGRRPYPDHQPDMAFRSWLRASQQNRLGPPRIVCQEMYALMRECWKVDPDSRPTVSQCKRQIAETLERKSNSMYITVVRTLSDARQNLATNRQTLSNRPNRLDSPEISTSEIPEVQMQIAEGSMSENGQDTSRNQSEDIEMQDSIHPSMIKCSPRPYVAASRL